VAVDIERLKSAADIVSVIGSYVSLRKRAGEFIGLCPFHPDKNPSFYVVPKKGIYHCFSCGASGDVIDFIANKDGLDFKAAAAKLGAQDTWAPTAPIVSEAKPLPERVTSKPPADAPPPSFHVRGLGDPSNTYTIRDLDGSLIGYECRYENGGGKKEIRVWSWGARGDFAPTWGLGHLNAPRPLYGLERLAEKPAAVALITEGPKKADAGARLLPDYASLSWTGGANAWHKHEWGVLAGRAVLIIPDNDEPGIAAGQKLSALLADPRGLACRVRIVDPTGQPEGWDIADWTGTTEELIAWAKPRARDFTVADEPSAPQSEPPPLEAYQDEPPPSVAQIKPQPRKRHLAVVAGNTALAPDPDAEPLPQALSEDHLADVFAEQQGEDWRFVKRWEKWFRWDGGGWLEDETGEVFDVARGLCRAAAYWPEAAALPPTGKRQLGQRRIAGNVRDMAGADRRIAATVDQWDVDPWLLGVPGGVFDLQNGKLIEAAREHYITKRTAIAPARGPHPLWDKVIARATGSDKTMAHYLSKWAGYMLTGDTREEAFLFVHGPGGSGKSTFVQAIRDCMGSYAKATRIETFMSQKHGEHPTEIADLAGARMVSAPETEEGSRWNEGRIKMLTGRDKVKARFMNRDYFEFDPVCKIMIFGNHRPRLHSVGEEMKRRIHLVEFPDSIPQSERDGSLKLAIREEYPAILQWMIDGCIAWQQEGLGRPEAVSLATDDYLDSQDTLGAWIEECCERSEVSRCLVSGAYRSFEAWAKARGEYVPSVTVFSEKMQARGIEKRKVSVMFFIGLGLKDTGEPQYSSRYPD
jgi:putative DNA primase/helicase